MWYSRLFTTERSYCFHELTRILRRHPSNEAMIEHLRRQTQDHDDAEAGRRLLLEGFPEYFARHWEQAERGLAAVGNSDGTMTPMLAALWLLWPRMRFLFSFRNGVGQVNSMWLLEPTFEPAIRAIWRARYGEGDHFERCCRYWRTQVAALEAQRDRLVAQGADVRETRLERMVGDPDELERVWEWLVGGWDEVAERNLALRGTRVNARAGAERPVTPDEVWASWTAERRSLFLEICGETQSRLGYPTPTARSAP
jgi:hypothetical protein